jgi:2-polyprenyl-6-methoxyphenol hydroxylase-like FAD-dependent oxidoreductase
MRVLISGAGVAGPSLAYFLGKIGARVTIFEKAPDLLPHGQNIDVNGSAMAVMKYMGLLEELKRYNTTEKGTIFIGPTGKPFAPFPVRDGFGSFTATTEILRGDLSLICYRASLRFPTVKYCFGTIIEEVVQNDEKGVKVKTSNGDIQEYDLLVAADGQWSRVRKQCFSPDTITTLDKGMYCVYFTIPRMKKDNDWWKLYHALGSRVVSIRPDPHGTIRAFFSIMPSTDEQEKKWAQTARADRESKNKLLREEFFDAGWQSQRLLDEMVNAPDFYFQKIEQIKMTKWSNSRVICLGDAAYAPTPLTGAGANLALLGAYVLAGELSKVAEGEHPSKALEAYETAFRPFVEDTQKIPSIFPSAAHPGTPFERWILQVVVGVLAKILALPIFGWISPKIDAEDYKLPTYAAFGEKSVET